jgi:hypothetical protein
MFATIIGLSLSVGIAAAVCPDDEEFTSEFRLQDCRFTTKGVNPYFPLIPGHQLVLEGEAEGARKRAVITVLRETQVIHLNGRWIRTRVVEERESENGIVFEISRNFFALCLQTNDVFYFGEDVFVCDIDATGGFAQGSESQCTNGGPPAHPGQWRAGVNGAMPGVIMPGGFLLGSKYFQEVAFADGAADRGENVAMGLTFNANGFHFEGCVKVEDTNSVENVCEDGDEKTYCPSVGLVQDEELVLVDINRLHHHGDDDEDDN